MNKKIHKFATKKITTTAKTNFININQKELNIPQILSFISMFSNNTSSEHLFINKFEDEHFIKNITIKASYINNTNKPIYPKEKEATIFNIICKLLVKRLKNNENKEHSILETSLPEIFEETNKINKTIDKTDIITALNILQQTNFKIYILNKTTRLFRYSQFNILNFEIYNTEKNIQKNIINIGLSNEITQMINNNEYFTINNLKIETSTADAKSIYYYLIQHFANAKITINALKHEKSIKIPLEKLYFQINLLKIENKQDKRKQILKRKLIELTNNKLIESYKLDKTHATIIPNKEFIRNIKRKNQLKTERNIIRDKSLKKTNIKTINYNLDKVVSTPNSKDQYISNIFDQSLEQAKNDLPLHLKKQNKI